ncbi:MlaD family protein [Patulibacter defluvii]|uniref:MlaD family protein n=1 Tax=Patulibacter defluvii TaxID=3095358 RepID=UPI002A74A8EF|nr:MlaD family protein [Patulibacter sp. DM4]
MSRRTRRSGRGRFEIQPGQHRPKHVRNGAFFVAFVAVFLWVIYTKPTVPGFGTSGTEVTADVASGANVRPGYTPVRVQGVDVGQVTGVERAPSGRGVRISFRVDDGKGVAVKQDATVALRWRTLLGRNLYVDLQPGSRSAPDLGGRTIALNRTTVQNELDEAIEPLDDDGRQALKTVVREFDRGFADGTGYRQTTKSLGPAMRALGSGLRALRGTEPGDLQQLVRETSATAGAVARSEVNLAGMITNGRLALGVTAARQADLRGLLSAAPGALAETRATMARLRTTLDVLDPLAEQLRPGARKLAGSAQQARRLLVAATPLLRDAEPTVRDLRPAVQDLTRLTGSGNDFIGAITPTLDRLIHPILPWARQKNVEADRPNYQLIGPTLSNVGGATSYGDRLGAVANFEAGVGESVEGLSPCKTWITNSYIPADQKVQCELLVRVLTGVMTGTPLDQVQVKGGAVSQATTRSLLKDKPELRAVARGLRTADREKKEATR